MHDLGLNPQAALHEKHATRYTLHATTMNTATWARHLTQSAAATHTVT